jgi:hypothetical protein
LRRRGRRDSGNPQPRCASSRRHCCKDWPLLYAHPRRAQLSSCDRQPRPGHSRSAATTAPQFLRHSCPSPGIRQHNLSTSPRTFRVQGTPADAGNWISASPDYDGAAGTMPVTVAAALCLKLKAALLQVLVPTLLEHIHRWRSYQDATGSSQTRPKPRRRYDRTAVSCAVPHSILAHHQVCYCM